MIAPPQIIVGFFGLTRSLRFTVDSIQSHVLQPLNKLGIPIVRIGHFNIPDRIDNPRSNESGLGVDVDEHLLLNLDHVVLERQNDALIANRLAVARGYPDPFGDGYTSIKNLCHQLRSLERLWSLVTSLKPSSDALVLFLRADLLVIDRLNLERDVVPLASGLVDLIVPGWQGWGGLNDRLAFCSMAAAKHYVGRGACIPEACAHIGALHAETLLSFAVSVAGLKTGFTAMRALRMRANGEIAPMDLAMLDACQNAAETACSDKHTIMG